MARPHTIDTYIFKYVRHLYLGASWIEVLVIPWASTSSHMNFSICTFSLPLYASIWLKFWPSWVAWLLCLCPTFPLVRLGHKGSTSAIVTARSSGCVPQTGWSQKLAFLREYSVGEIKDDLFTHFMRHQMLFLRLFTQSRHAYKCMHTQGKEPLTELFSLEDVSYNFNVI